MDFDFPATNFASKVSERQSLVRFVKSQGAVAMCLFKWSRPSHSIILGFDSRWGLGIFLFTTASRTALGPTQPPIQWVPGALSLWVKRPGREADYSPPSSAEVKE
jgi:hypothetical protein